MSKATFQSSGRGRAEIAEDTTRRLATLGLSGISTNEGIACAGLMKTGARYGVGLCKLYDGATFLGFFDHITAWEPILDRLEAAARLPIAA